MAGGDGVRVVGKAYLVLGLAAAGLALYAITLDPATFRQIQQQVQYTTLHRRSTRSLAHFLADVRSVSVFLL